MRVSIFIILSILNFFPSLSFSDAPKINYNSISFSYKNESAKEVILLFSFDNYSTNYHMSRAKNGNFTLTLSRENIKGVLEEGEYYYRVIVDGIYTYDTLNPQFKIDPYLGRLSSFTLDSLFISSQNGPVKIKDHTYRFFYRASSFQDKVGRVMLVGNFNNFKTYEYILKQSDTDSRIWYIDVSITQDIKQVQYMFVVDGVWVKDINNSHQGRNGAGQEVSLFDIQD